MIDEMRTVEQWLLKLERLDPPLDFFREEYDCAIENFHAAIADRDRRRSISLVSASRELLLWMPEIAPSHMNPEEWRECKAALDALKDAIRKWRIIDRDQRFAS